MFANLLKVVLVETDMFDFSGLRVKLLSDKAKLPTRNETSAGYDLYATERGLIPHEQRAIIPIGIATEMPHGYYGKIFDRSGLAARDGLTVLAGVIDNDYRGEWKVILHNTTDLDYYVEVGDRVAQVVFMSYGNFKVTEVDELSDTVRDACGLGSSGK